MKLLLSAVLFFCTLFYSFTFSSETNNDEHCPVVEEEMPVSTLIKICDFASSFTPGVGCSPVSMEIIIPPDDPCIGVGFATVRTVNLTGSPVQGVPYSLPFGMPELYYKYTVVGETSITLGPINKFYYNGESINGEPVYEATAKMDFLNYINYCGNDGYGHVLLDVELVDVNDNLYPVASYAGTNQVFSCNVFEENCNACDPSCTNSSPVYNVGGCGDCSSMEENECKRSSEETELINVDRMDFNVSPNPFSELLTLNYSLAKESNISIEILDAAGAIVYSKELHSEAGVHTLYVDTHDFANGIYFSRMIVEGEMFTEKVIKSR